MRATVTTRTSTSTIAGIIAILLVAVGLILPPSPRAA
jgi:hypothetical protein